MRRNADAGIRDDDPTVPNIAAFGRGVTEPPVSVNLTALLPSASIRLDFPGKGSIAVSELATG
jgi:hypothetical protein